jgi:peptide-methionine (S)-S-oxide reductase
VAGCLINAQFSPHKGTGMISTGKFLSAAALVVVMAIPAGMFELRGDAGEMGVKIPPPAIDESTSSGLETVVLAGGCFWGVQGVFQHTAGITSAVAGYAGGAKADPTYEEVSTGSTGHAESVQITFDPKQISYGKILQIFFSVVQDPTEKNFQGPDHGTQYRSAVFTTSNEQMKVAAAYIAQLDAAKVFAEPIVTEVTSLNVFYMAEDYHQDYATLHPDQPYIAIYDLPKIANLKAMFADVWRDKPALVSAANVK